jgi:hypothetical protein
MPTRYYKKYQRDGLHNYYKVLNDHQPPACERVIFLSERPTIDFSEYGYNRQKRKSTTVQALPA